MFGMTSAMTYVGVVDMTKEESLHFRRAEILAELARDTDDASMETRANYMLGYEKQASELMLKNKQMLMASGFNEKRGDLVALVPRAFDPGVKLAYKMGDWERSEPKPVLKDKTA